LQCGVDPPPVVTTCGDFFWGAEKPAAARKEDYTEFAENAEFTEEEKK
jgi:hypothetical protein